MASRTFLWLAATQAWIATLASLYLSEVAGFHPCMLCWFQRAFMYTLAPILTTAAFVDDRKTWRTGLLFSVPGLIIALYHTVIYYQANFGTKDTFSLTPCTTGPNTGCATRYIEWFGGIVSIPSLALIAFSIITLSLGVVAYTERSRASRAR